MVEQRGQLHVLGAELRRGGPNGRVPNNGLKRLPLRAEEMIGLKGAVADHSRSRLDDRDNLSQTCYRTRT